MDAGAGNLYAEVPVTIGAMQSDGSAKTFSGSYTLHRSNLPPFDQLGWRIARANVAATAQR